MKWILPTIVIAQFLCTSLWFAGNSIINELIAAHQLDSHFLAHFTSSIQFGFISGTFLFAVLTISDRFSPSKVFFFSSLLAGLFNLGLSLNALSAHEIILFRFLTGFFLAGIYPVGMKIASDYYQAGLGKSLGFLVGALVLGTAFPHLLKDLVAGYPWKYVIYSTTILSLIGGLSMLCFVPNGPYRKKGQKIQFTAFLSGFKIPPFRSAAFGYFGHMWELYTFWAFIPTILVNYNNHFLHEAHINVPLLAFSIIASGGLACTVSGLLSLRYGPKRIAVIALAISCICCLISPFFLQINTRELFISFLFIWGTTVVADSPLFSTLVARNAPEETRGTALTIVNCIGFGITIVSIQFLNQLSNSISPQFIYLFLAIGPILGLVALTFNRKVT